MCGRVRLDRRTPRHCGDRLTAKRRYGRSRRDLAEIAIRQFEAKGFEETTVEEIAEAAEYSPRTFHRQFPSKEDVVFFDLPDILAPLSALPLPGSVSAWSAVSAVFIENAHRWESWSADVARSRTRLIFDEPALYRRFLDITDQWEAVLTRVFCDERGSDPSQDAYAQLLAGCAISACRVALRSWLVRPERCLPEHMTDALDQLACGFGVARVHALGSRH